ncbi:MAG: hypothetical protein ACRCYQ_08550 [Nocardioides sp.]
MSETAEFTDFVLAAWPRVYRAAFFVAGDRELARSATIEGFRAVSGEWRDAWDREAAVRRASLRHVVGDGPGHGAGDARTPDLPRFPPEDVPGADEDIERDRAFWSALRRLDARQRTLLLLRHQEPDRTLLADEVSAVLGLRPSVIGAELAEAELALGATAAVDPDDRIRRILRHIDDLELDRSVHRSPALLAEVSLTRRRESRRHRVRLSGGAVALAGLVALAGTMLVSTGPTVQPPVPPAPTGSWQELPPAPLSPRSEPVVTWTGSEVIVLGGIARRCNDRAADDAGCALRDGAAYDVATRTWRAIAAAPFAVHAHHDAQVGRTWVLAKAGRWWAYDLVRDRWRGLPAPKGVPASSGLAATDTAVYVVGSRSDSPVQALNLDTDTWSALPPDSAEPALGRRALVSTDAGLVAIGADPKRLIPPLQTAEIRASLFDGESWSRLPSSQQRTYACCWWSTGRRLMHVERLPVDTDGELHFAGGLVLDTARDPWRNGWRYLGEQPLDNRSPEVWRLDAAGRRFGVFSGLLFDDREQVWSWLPRPAQASKAGSGVWVGDRLLAVGTAGTSERPRRTTRVWWYTPPGAEIDDGDRGEESA